MDRPGGRSNDLAHWWSRRERERDHPGGFVDFDQDSSAGRRNRAIGFSVLGLVALGVVLGLLVGGLGLAAMRSAGLSGADSTDSATTEPTPDPPTASESQTVEPSPTEDPETRRTPRNRPTLTASPSAVGLSEEIYLTGRFPQLAAGVTLQVQRRESGTWLDFADVTATTQEDGSFSTYVLTGQAGTNTFRLLAEVTGDATQPVQVQVG